MKCRELLEELSYKCVRGSVDKKITEVVYDSRKITEGCMFICICGYQVDGHSFAAEAASKGAGAIVVQKEVNLPDACDTAVILVEDTRYAMAFIAAAYFGHPADRLKVIGITGTKGKTTTTYLIKSILERAGYRVGLVGTIETMIGDKHIPANNTTPESFLLQQYFKEMEEAGCEIVVMEVASQGLKLHRTQGFTFEIGIFTNLEPDHIGPNEHADFEEYQACKGLLFQQCRLGIVNRDDAHVEAVLKGHTCRLETIGLGAIEPGAEEWAVHMAGGNRLEESLNPSIDLYAQDLKLVNKPGELGVAFQVRANRFHLDKEKENQSPWPGDFSVEVPTPGRFSVYNALTAIAVCRHFKVEIPQIQKALLGAHVKGRIEMVPVSDQFTLLIDYAHNAMSLKSLLSTLREYQPTRLVCVFGCGGNRSKIRRFEMGEVSGNYADFTIITSDNPRFEKPQDIIEDIKIGIQKTTGEYIEICDRKEAIAYAISHGQPGDIIVLAGKGHEDYQEIEGVKYPMDERVLIAEILKEKRGERG
ncbi:Mur ligase family protein [Parablautia muri]|uniref:UDP-N-acetylmuramoyl-L-alanyl-D-glutamate--2,6-diaminopimelate ligase n=1 Tax=Parablautia muri TaxID=2320879 RepID=A0A9X5GT30_9FIRM|nr:UDP-N-acetylmuramoyl-L-alanyl-D-glutamate--2,6-diaminopimelate ligase [Parablautia muri]NBJ93774.1 UDP-N-acetylmuramoyl-L-alanyl-D-glutamate--2,6-diaminopimelate ligase [Parablautia muri]